MSNDEIESVLASEYDRAGSLYSSRPVEYRGNLVVSQADAACLPLDIGKIYQNTADEIASKPREAGSFAKTFGAVRVQLALDGAPTQFVLEQDGTYAKDPRTEIGTLAVRSLEDTLRADEVDGRVAYVLASDGQNQSVEISLVQALHMIDTAMVTGQYTAELPLIRVATTEEIVTLKQSNPEVFLRTYGNVRKLRDVPLLLGCVVDTSALEASGVTTSSLARPRASVEQPSRERISVAREKMAFVGITTAKKPHIGHGFLLAKAIADSPNGQVLVELNDQGPRVESMLVQLANSLGTSIEDAAKQVTEGAVPIDLVESCYQARDAMTTDVNTPYALTANNAYYRELLALMQAPNIPFSTIANSEMGDLMQDVATLPGYRRLFSEDSGMSILTSDPGIAMPIEKYGKPTLPGAMAQLGGRYTLTLVDSPPSLSKQELAIVAGNGMELEQSSGCGLLLDFASASGTNGRSIALESLIGNETPAGAELAAIRKVMDEAYFFVSETGSLCPNFASNEAFLAAYAKNLEQVEEGDIEAILRRPIVFKNVKKQLFQELLAQTYEFPVKGRVSAGEVCSLLQQFPVLAGRLPGRVVAEAANASPELSIRKNILCDKTQKKIQLLRSADPLNIVELVRLSCEKEGMFLSSYLEGTELGQALSYMGYRGGSTMETLDKIAQAKGVFKIS